MTRKQTSAKVSKIAAKYLALTPALLRALLEEDQIGVFADIRTLAASCLSQDEVKGAKPSAAKRKKADQLMEVARQVGDLSNEKFVTLLHPDLRPKLKP